MLRCQGAVTRALKRLSINKRQLSELDLQDLRGVARNAFRDAINILGGSENPINYGKFHFGAMFEGRRKFEREMDEPMLPNLAYAVEFETYQLFKNAFTRRRIYFPLQFEKFNPPIRKPG